LGPSALHVEGRSSSFSLGPLADSQRSCRSPSFGGRACSRPLPRLLRRADGARSLLVVHRGRHLVEQVDKCVTKQRGTTISTSLPLSPPLTGGWNWGNWGVMAVHVLPKVTSDRPLGSPRGERELAVASSPFMPPSPTFLKERQGWGRVIRSVCPRRTPQYPFQGLVLTRGDPPSIRHPSSQP